MSLQRLDADATVELSPAELKAAVRAVSLCAWEAATDAWRGLAERGHLPCLAAVSLIDPALRCGDFKDLTRHWEIFEGLLGGTPLHAQAEERVRVIHQRRSAMARVDTSRETSPEALRRAARDAMHCKLWRRSIELWARFQERGGDRLEALVRMADCAAALGEHAAAVAHLEAALQERADEELALQLDRARRLAQRGRDGFHKHVERFSTGPVLMAARMALASRAGGRPDLLARLAEDLRSASRLVGYDLLAGAAPSTAAAPSASGSASQAAGQAAAPRLVTREIELAPSRPPTAAARPAEPPAIAAPGQAVSGLAVDGVLDNLARQLAEIIAGRALAANEPEPVESNGSSPLLEGRINPELVARLPLIASRPIGEALADLQFPPLPEAARALIQASQLDTVMFVANGFSRDARVVRTAAAVASFGRRMLAIGIRENADPVEYRLTELPDGTPLLLMPNMNRPITLALKARKKPLDRGPRHELWLASMGLMLGPLLKLVRGPRELVFHTHDYHGLYVGGFALAADDRRRYRWFHDAHEFVRQYDIIDPGLQAAGIAWEERFLRSVDRVSTVSEELAERLRAAYDLPRLPAVIYSSNRLADRRKYAGPTAKAKLGLAGKRLLVHSGTIIRGRGVDHIVKVLPYFPDVHLLLITESKNDYMDEIADLATSLRVADRVHYHPYLPYDEAMGFVADADIGMIPMDRYGNTDVALPNKLFDYVMAGIPIVSSDADAMARFLREWPIGTMFKAGDAQSLRGALAALLSQLQAFRAKTVTLMSKAQLKLSWEAQIIKLSELYFEE